MQSEHKNNVLLTELIIVALFFSLIAVTVVQMFVAAHRRGADAALEQQAQIVAQDWAERLSGQNDPGAVLLAAGFEQHAERAYRMTRAEDTFHIEVTFDQPESSEAGQLISADLKVFDKKALRAEGKAAADPVPPLVELPVASYISAEGVCM